MTKQELIKYFELLPYVSITQMGKKSFIDLIEQLDEQEIVTIPKIVVDWIEKCKAKEKSLLNALLYTPEGVNSWVDDPDNQETFALAWIFGYKVEEEKRYIVSLKNGQPLVKAPLGGNFYFNQNITAGNCKATRKQLEEAGFGWVFDCPGIEVEEVE